MRVEAMYISPVKSLALQRAERARFEKAGIPGDRAFFIVDDRGRLFTQRDCFALVQVHADYDVATDALKLTFPDGRIVEEPIELAQEITAPFWGDRPVPARVLRGGWSHHLSKYVGQDVHLVKPDAPGTAYDGFPISMCSTASVAALAEVAGRKRVDERRFRQNLLISASEPHVEDSWLGHEVRIGGATVRIKIPDSRCVITTRDPDSGEHDMDTLKLIASYRTDQPKEVNFGVYATVVVPGDVAVGDEVTPTEVASPTEANRG